MRELYVMEKHYLKQKNTILRQDMIDFWENFKKRKI